MQKEFAVAGVAGDRRFGHRYADQSYLSGRTRRFVDDPRLNGRIADDAFLADLAAAGLELRLHQRDDVPARFAAAAAREERCSRSEMNDTSMVTRSTGAGQM